MPRLVAIFLIVGIVSLVPAGPAVAGSVPAGFTDSLVTSVGAPTALAFTPDGRLLIGTQPGQLWVYAGGKLQSKAALDLAGRVCTDSERGLLGVAVDPDFGDNRFVYLYYTADKRDAGGCVNRMARFTLSDNNTISAASEFVLIDNIPSPAGNHNGGDVQVGKDGHLYVSVGDGGCDYAGDSGCAWENDAARDQHILLGKILRITRDGGIPPDNPFQGADSARCNASGRTEPGKKCQETFARGLRNPFRLAFDPNAGGTRFFVNDVGQNDREEIDLGQAGADYGWNCREGTRTNFTRGPCSPTPPSLVDPLFEYGHDASGLFGGCDTITGGAFIPNGLWPAPFGGGYLFGDFGCGKLFLLPSSGQGNAGLFASELGPIIHLTFGPSGGTQALYYSTYANGGQVRKIERSSGSGGGTAAEQVDALVAAVGSYELTEQAERSLLGKLQGIRKTIVAGKVKQACGKLGGIVKKLQSLSGKGLTLDEFNEAVQMVDRVRASLGCG